MAIAAGDDSTSLLQVSAGVRHSQGQRILAAVGKEGSTICVEAAAGDVAPVAGSYIAKMSQQAVEVAAGSVAVQAGSFCVPKQDVLLMQRTFGLNTARDFEAALGKKKEKKEKQTTTTTTMDFENFNFAENIGKEVMVQQCPDEKAGLLQSMDATVAHKGGDSHLQKNREADEMRVCECRSFLKSSVGKIGPMSLQDIQKLLEKKAAPPTQLLQRNLDAALVTKKQQEATTTSTTSTTTTTEQINHQSQVKGMTIACTTASELPVKGFGSYGMVDEVQLPSWAVVAKLLNDPAVASMFKAANITDGWQHCDQSWVVHGACGKFLPVPTTTTTTTTALADCPLARPEYQPASDYYCNLAVAEDSPLMKRLQPGDVNCGSCAKKPSSRRETPQQQTFANRHAGRSVDDMQAENAANIRDVMQGHGHNAAANAAIDRLAAFR